MISKSKKNARSKTFAYTQTESLVRDFVSRGIVVLSPESLEIPLDVHETIYQKEKVLFANKMAITPDTAKAIPQIFDILNAPGLIKACNILLGEDWAIVPFTHNTPFISGSHDQHWHKDDNGPFNGRKQRHHQAIQIEMLYYPQEVSIDMGPTAVVPFSQYWTFDHEENHDNFAGAEHLDFNYQIDGMEKRAVSGPNSTYSIDDIQKQNTAHDVRMRQAVTDTEWPMVLPFEVGPLKAGSVVLYSHNLIHRGNHRRDDFDNWKRKPRFMWRFWLYRTKQTKGEAEDIDWQTLDIDPMTGVNFSTVKDDTTAVWDHQYHWLKTGQIKAPSEITYSDKKLALQLTEKNLQGEPLRIGAAYRLAAGNPELATITLNKALYHHRENVRRAATYGLAAVGEIATESLLEACQSPIKWVRKSALYVLGESGSINKVVTDTLSNALLEDESVYVRSVAASALGCFGRRTLAESVSVLNTTIIAKCLEALLTSLDQEENRLGMNITQNRSIKFVRPTDDSDICEGIGIDYGIEKYKPVRSAVRENALWSIVILCSHGPKNIGNHLETLYRSLETIMQKDENIFCVGLATDAWVRLRRTDDAAIDSEREIGNQLRRLPIRSWESLARSGLDKKIFRSVEHT